MATVCAAALPAPVEAGSPGLVGLIESSGGKGTASQPVVVNDVCAVGAGCGLSGFQEIASRDTSFSPHELGFRKNGREFGRGATVAGSCWFVALHGTCAQRTV